MATWQLQTAKARLSELLRAARDEGPQTITVRGAEAYLVMRKEDAPRAPDAPEMEAAPKTLWDLFEPLRQSGIGNELAESIEAGNKELRGGVRDRGVKFERDE